MLVLEWLVSLRSSSLRSDELSSTRNDFLKTSQKRNFKTRPFGAHSLALWLSKGLWIIVWLRSSWSSATEFLHYLISPSTRTTTTATTREWTTRPQPGSSESRKFFRAKTRLNSLFFLTPSERRIVRGKHWKSLFFFFQGFAFLRFAQAKEQLTTKCLGQLILCGSYHPSYPECSGTKTYFVANIWVGGEKCALFQGQGRQRQFQ